MDWSDEQLESLRQLSYRVETVEDMAARGALDPAQAAAQRDHYLDLAAAVAGEPLGADQLMAARSVVEGGVFAGFFDFVSLAWLGAAGLLLVALIWLAAIYVVPFVKSLPYQAHELMMYGACGALIALPWHHLSGGGAVALAGVGCLGLIPSLGYSFDKRFRRSRLRKLSVMRLFLGALATAWAAAAIAYGSAALGGLAVAAALGLTGTVLLPVFELTEFTDSELIPLAMAAALALVLVFGGLELAGAPGPTLAAITPVFQPGATLLGGLTWFGGCLALASRRYKQRRERWVMAQALALGTALVALYLGSVYAPLDGLREAGGTFLAAYLLEKFFEIPWRRSGYAWMCLLLAGILYAGASFAEAHPQYFIGI